MTFAIVVSFAGDAVVVDLSEDFIAETTISDDIALVVGVIVDDLAVIAFAFVVVGLGGWRGDLGELLGPVADGPVCNTPSGVESKSSVAIMQKREEHRLAHFMTP